MWLPREKDHSFAILPSQAPTPKVWPAAESAWQIRLPLPWTLPSVNVFLFRAGNGFLLLDTGLNSTECLEALDASLRSLGVTWHSITEILVSHLHPDHLGAAAEIRRRSGAPVRMPALEARLVRPLRPGRRFFAEAGDFLLFHGMPAEKVEAIRRQAAAGTVTYERLLVDGSLAPGDTIQFDGGTLEVVPAPGHSPAQVCLYCVEQGVLFSTDAILPRVTPNIGVHWYYRDNPLGDYMETLSGLETLEADWVMPGHGRPFRDHREWIAVTRHHHERRCETILEALWDRPINAYEIAGSVWGEDQSLMDRRFAMAEALSHLQYMALQQRVEKISDNGAELWKLA